MMYYWAWLGQSLRNQLMSSVDACDQEEMKQACLSTQCLSNIFAFLHKDEFMIG